MPYKHGVTGSSPVVPTKNSSNRNPYSPASNVPVPDVDPTQWSTEERRSDAASEHFTK